MHYLVGGFISVRSINNPILAFFLFDENIKLKRLYECGDCMLNAYDVRLFEFVILLSQLGENASGIPLALETQWRGFQAIALTRGIIHVRPRLAI